ncbi:TAXI family TRAP transporter solute-binding subunit [Chloroflexota bacterium]
MDVKRKRMQIIGYCLVLSLMVTMIAGCAAEKPEAKPAPGIAGVEMPELLVIAGRGGPGSAYTFSISPLKYHTGAAYPRMYISELGVGTFETCDAVQKGEAQIGRATGTAIYHSYMGITAPGIPVEEPMDQLRQIYCFPPVSLQMQIVRADSDIYTMKDLVGKRISEGPAPSTYADMVFPSVLAANGLTKEDIKKAGGMLSNEYASQGLDLVVSGLLDAADYYTIHPQARLTQFFKDPGLRIISLTPEEVKMVTDRCAGYYPQDIPANTYTGQTEVIHGAGYTVPVIASADIPDDVVYNILAATWDDDGKYYRESHAALADFELEDVVKYSVIPWHPGAVKYWEERGFKIPKPLTETLTPPAPIPAK